MQKVEIENYKNHGIWISDNEYSIFWFRGKEYFSYDATEELVEKSRKSDKDALEVMFYLEHGRWPKEGELENYNKTDVKTYVGDGFLIYEENGEYEIEIERDWGKAQRYPINKELKGKALKSPRDGYEVAIYAETGGWPPKDPKENSRKFIRKHPKLILINPELKQKLFSKEEYEHLVKLAKEEQEKEQVAEKEREEVRKNPEIILRASEKKRNLFSKEEIEHLEVLAKEKCEKKKRIRRGIFIATIVILIGSFFTYIKVNNRNPFEEMYNSYYHLSPYKSVEYMPQLNEHYRPTKTLWDTLAHSYSNKASLTYKGFKKSITLVEDGQIVLEKYIPISGEASIEIYYSYDIKTYKLTNYVIAKEGFKEVPVEDFLEKYNISKGYIKGVSDKLLDSVLTDWKNFSGSPYSKDNMGTITIEKDEILK